MKSIRTRRQITVFEVGGYDTNDGVTGLGWTDEKDKKKYVKHLVGCWGFEVDVSRIEKQSFTLNSTCLAYFNIINLLKIFLKGKKRPWLMIKSDVNNLVLTGTIRSNYTLNQY
jgi:hypothetical protein